MEWVYSGIQHTPWTHTGRINENCELLIVTRSCAVPRSSMTIDCVREMWTPMSRWTPQHSRQMSTPRFTDNHSGSVINVTTLHAGEYLPQHSRQMSTPRFTDNHSGSVINVTTLHAGEYLPQHSRQMSTPRFTDNHSGSVINVTTLHAGEYLPQHSRQMSTPRFTDNHSVAAWLRWRHGVAVERRTRDREVVGSSLDRALRRKNSGQVSHT